MSTNTIPRQPKGSPTGGQFSTRENPEATSDLIDESKRVPTSIAEWTVIPSAMPGTISMAKHDARRMAVADPDNEYRVVRKPNSERWTVERRQRQVELEEFYPENPWPGASESQFADEDVPRGFHPDLNIAYRVSNCHECGDEGNTSEEDTLYWSGSEAVHQSCADCIAEMRRDPSDDIEEDGEPAPEDYEPSVDLALSYSLS